MERGIRDGEDQEEPHVRLEVREGLPDVVPSPLAGDDAHLVGTKSLDGNNFFVLVKELGFHWRVGHHKEDVDAIKHGEEAAEHEDNLGYVS